MSKITVIGAGNGGVTAAYHFAKEGHKVCVYDNPLFATQINAIKEKGGIKALEREDDTEFCFPGFEHIDLATTNIQKAMEYSDIFVMVCPSFAQEVLFSEMLPYLKDGQTVLLMPGNYGGLVLKRILKEKGLSHLDISIADAVSIPWACRITEPAVISIMGIKEFLPVSIMSNKVDDVKEKLDEILPVPVEVLENPIVAGLENINFGGHPLLTTLNMGLLENYNGQFNYYGDCCSMATARAAARMDKERLSVGKELGVRLRTELEAMNALYACNCKSVYEFNRGSVTHGKIHNAPSDSKSRYITEDVPYLLVPCYELATKLGIRVPIVESCIHIASAYNETDYFETGRTLARMGFQEGLTKEQFIEEFNKLRF